MTLILRGIPTTLSFPLRSISYFKLLHAQSLFSHLIYLIWSLNYLKNSGFFTMSALLSRLSWLWTKLIFWSSTYSSKSWWYFLLRSDLIPRINFTLFVLFNTRINDLQSSSCLLSKGRHFTSQTTHRYTGLYFLLHNLVYLCIDIQGNSIFSSLGISLW